MQKVSTSSTKKVMALFLATLIMVAVFPVAAFASHYNEHTTLVGLVMNVTMNTITIEPGNTDITFNTTNTLVDSPVELMQGDMVALQYNNDYPRSATYIQLIEKGENHRVKPAPMPAPSPAPAMKFYSATGTVTDYAMGTLYVTLDNGTKRQFIYNFDVNTQTVGLATTAIEGDRVTVKYHKTADAKRAADTIKVIELGENH